MGPGRDSRDRLLRGAGLVRVQFTAQNRLPGTIVEAGIDDFEYYAGGAMVASRGGWRAGRACRGPATAGTAARESGIEFRLEVERPGMWTR